MKKLLSTFYILSLFIPFFEVAKANEYKFFKANNSIINDIPTVKFYGVSSSGTETLLNTWESSTTNIKSFSGNFDTAPVDQYAGKIYFEIKETPRGSDPNVITVLEYDLLNNTVQKVENISQIDNVLIYPKGIVQMISEKTDGSIHIGENSAVFKEENGREKFWAQDANGKSIPIDITNGSKLLINGRDVEQSINNVGALSAALTGLPTVPTDTTLACGLGTGTHGGDFALSGGCASKVNEKLSINYAASMTMPGQDYAGDFEDTFSARAGFIWKLGKSVKPTLISMKDKQKLTNEITDLKSENLNLNKKITKFETEKLELLARLERLEKVALGESKSKDLATIQLPFKKK